MNTKTIYFKDKPRSKFFKAEIPEQFNSYPDYWQSLTDDGQRASPEPVEVPFAEYAVSTAPDFLPFDNHLLVLPEPLPEKVGSLYVPPKDKEQEKTHWGVVVISGTNPEEKTVEAQIGDFVGYSRFAGTDVEIGSETYRLIRSSEIHGKVPGKSLYKLAKEGTFEADHVTLPGGLKVPIHLGAYGDLCGEITPTSDEVKEALANMNDQTKGGSLATDYKINVSAVISGTHCTLSGFFVLVHATKKGMFRAYWDYTQPK